MISFALVYWFDRRGGIFCIVAIHRVAKKKINWQYFGVHDEEDAVLRSLVDEREECYWRICNQ